MSRRKGQPGGGARGSRAPGSTARGSQAQSNIARWIFRAALGKRLPRTSGRLELRGPSAEIRIRRDGWGVPHIEAGSDRDAWFGVGFCQGQDRAFQLELLSRLVRGTLSELVGAEALPMDRLSRRIGFFRSAARRLDAMDPARAAIVDAFALGVMRGAREGSTRKPHELALLRSELGTFTGADVAGILAVLSFALASNWDCELARFEVLLRDGRGALEALEPAYPADHPVTDPPGAPHGKALGLLAADLEAFAAAAGGGGASNNWVLSPSRTRTGRPLLANDPHLTPGLPPHWYLAHVRTPEWQAAGAGFVGTPGITVGHNDRLAWGITAGIIDNTDLYLEDLEPDGRSVRGPGGPEPCEVLREVIRVRGRAEQVEEVLVTPRGPLIWPPPEGERRGLSLRAVWLDPLPLRGFLEVHRSRTVEDLRACFAEWPLLPLNIVFAHEAGSVGWELAGEAPVRARGAHLVPLPAWDEGAAWVGKVPHSEMPRSSDPERGFLATANNAPLAAGRGPWLGADWLEGYRLARILEVLDSRRDWDVDDTLGLQLDTFSIPWRDMRSAVLRAPPLDPSASLALEVLSRWDGNVGTDSPGAAVFELFLAEMLHRIVEAKAPRAAEWAVGKGATALSPKSGFILRRVAQLSALLEEEPAGWFERPWASVVSDSLGNAVDRLADRCGPDPSSWGWGRLRTLRLRHPFGRKAALGRIFDRGPFFCPGDTNTIAQASLDLFDPLEGPLYIASLRAVIDVGRWERSRFALPGGQSGNPLSPHYDDQIPLWLSGSGIPIPWTEEEVGAAARSDLVLAPAADPGAAGAAFDSR